MKKALLIGLILIIIGLVAGYFIFGKNIPIQDLLGLKNIWNNLSKNIDNPLDKYQGIDKTRLYIILCGAGGLVGGIILALLFKRRKR